MYGDIYIIRRIRLVRLLGIYYYYYESVGVFLFGLDGGRMVRLESTGSNKTLCVAGGDWIFFSCFFPVSRWWAVASLSHSVQMSLSIYY